MGSASTRLGCLIGCDFLLFPEEELEILEREGAGEVLLAEDVFREGAFLFLEAADFFLDAVFHQQTVGEDGLLLADAVGAVDRLSLDGGIPPRIEKHDIGGRGQVQTGAAGLEADEKHSGAVVVLEFLHERPSVLGGTIEAEGLPFAGSQRLAGEVEHFEELGKDDDLLTLFHEGFEEIDQRGELRALFLRAERLRLSWIWVFRRGRAGADGSKSGEGGGGS